jgi:DNA-binding PadR family transcriptional regulator
MAPRLTTTTYCLLGLLHLSPFSAYELTKHMQRSALSSLWPRTEAAIYRESHRLAEAGLADATTEREGNRDRTVYRITPAGRAALQTWLAEPGEGLSFECEAAVKAFFGDATNVDALRAQLTALAAQFEARADRAEAVGSAWLAGELRFPDRIHYTAMSADLITRLELATHQWATDWLERTRSWRGTTVDEPKRTEAREVIEGIGAAIARRRAES